MFYTLTRLVSKLISMKFIQLSLAVIAIAGISLTSCKKKKPDVQAEKTCKLSKIVYYDTGVATDSISFVYQNNIPVRANFPQGFYFTFEYSGERISKRSYFEGAASLSDYYETAVYNSDGSIAKVEAFVRTNNTYTKDFVYEFTYNGGRIQRMAVTQNDGNGIFDLITDYVYTYTGTNITRTVYTEYDPVNGNSTETFNYTYDAIPNYFAKTKNILLLDFLFADFDGTVLPIILSQNNVTGVQFSIGTAPLSYTADEKQNMTSFSIAGQLLSRYFYQCD